ncbi:MAG: DUF4390 domain-containing protein [Candidatus Accumulibacter sp.]|jgi:hypothetical protein|nr:DUF4390 domain-containing protein [Accumulibacter sp.]
MRCCGKLEALLVGLALWLAAGAALASGIVAESARLVADEDGGFSLVADFRVDLNRRLEDAVNKGVVLYFTADFELKRSRWYWFDQVAARRGKTFQLSYHALTRQYRLSSGALHQSFFSLEDALRVLSRLRHWRVVDKDEVDSDVDYVASARLRLDPSQMAKTFQVSALSNRDWSLSSEWLVWNFSFPEAPPEDAAPGEEEDGDGDGDGKEEEEKEEEEEEEEKKEEEDAR